jgi:hypothetical protein
MSLSFRYIDNVDPYLKAEMSYFGKWLRKTYNFPVPFEIRLINQRILIDFDDTECALRWWLNSGRTESVKGEIAVGNFTKNLDAEGPDVAFPTVIAAISRVVKYYYQAINDLPIDEGQATEWGDKVMSSFIEKTAPPSAL